VIGPSPEQHLYNVSKYLKDLISSLKPGINCIYKIKKIFLL